MRCSDCKGSGKYVGALVVENCRKCQGTGIDDSSGPGIFDFSRVDELVEEYDKVTNFTSNSSPNYALIQVGSKIQVYDAGWFEANVKFIYTELSGINRGKTIVCADYACGRLRVLLDKICFNVTSGRWEYIRAGTPVWP